MAFRGGVWSSRFTEEEPEILNGIDPEKTVSLLRRTCPDALDRHDKEEIFLKNTTSLERNEALVQTLSTRPPEVREAFERIVLLHYPRLSSIIQPEQYRVLWLAPSPQHAAMVVYVLEKYAKATFYPTEEGGVNFLTRKAMMKFGVGESSAAMVVKLAFPVKPELFPSMVADVVEHRERERVDTAILTGVCEALSRDATVGSVLLPTSSKDGRTIVCPTAQGLQATVHCLQERCGNASWLGELRDHYKKHAYMDYQAVLLARLYVELQRVANGECSTWLEHMGAVDGSMQSAANMAAISRHLPDWAGGQLATALAKKKRTWRVDTHSPLGLSPKESVTSRTEERVRWFDGFPSPVPDSAPCQPLFGSVSLPGEGGTSTDTDTHLFYQACSSRLPQPARWLACKCVCHDSHSSTRELTAFAAVTMALEIVQLLRDHPLSYSA